MQFVILSCIKWFAFSAWNACAYSALENGPRVHEKGSVPNLTLSDMLCMVHNVAGLVQPLKTISPSIK